MPMHWPATPTPTTACSASSPFPASPRPSPTDKPAPTSSSASSRLATSSACPSRATPRSPRSAAWRWDRSTRRASPKAAPACSTSRSRSRTHDVGAHDLRCRLRGELQDGRRPAARHWPAAGLDARVRRHGAADLGRLCRRAGLAALGATPQRDSAVMLHSRRGIASRPPKWIKPQLTRLVDEAPTGNDWLHEIKYDGYRMHTRIDGREVSRTNLQSRDRRARAWG